MNHKSTYIVLNSTLRNAFMESKEGLKSTSAAATANNLPVPVAQYKLYGAVTAEAKDLMESVKE